jgi:hypothetical protein
MEVLGFLADSIGIFGALFSLLAWWKAKQIQSNLRLEEERQNKHITLILQSGGRTFELPIKLRRSEFSRAEVLGILGMIPLKSGKTRFYITSTSTKDFIDRIHAIIEGKGDENLVIHCIPEELEQFDFDKFKHKIL